MKVAVTGATGFVGRRLVARLLADGHAVRALVRDPTTASVPNDVERVAFDLESGSLPSGALGGVDAVLHLAAFLPPSYADPSHARRCLEVNALGTLALVLAAADAGVSTFVSVSSGNAYRSRSEPVTEDDALYPSARATYYLASKVCGETFVQHVTQSGPMRGVVLRPSAVYGPGMAGGLVPTLTKKLRGGEAVSLVNAGRFASDLVYVDDVVDACVAAATRDVRGAFNVGSGRSSTTLEVATTLAELLGAGADCIVLEPADAAAAAAMGFAPLDVSRARAELGYAPRSLRDGLARYLEGTRP